MAKHGFSVVAVDVAPAGLDKARRYAREAGVEILTLQGDLNDITLPGGIDVVLHFMFAFSEHPEVEVAPDWGSNQC